MKPKSWLLMVLPVFLYSSVAMAQGAEDSSIPDYNALNTLWVILAAAMVFFMQAGFGMVEAGLIRAKNAANVLMKNLLGFCLTSLGFYFSG